MNRALRGAKVFGGETEVPVAAKRVSYFDPRASHGKGEAMAATTLSIALHLAVFALLMLRGGPGSGPRNAAPGSGDGGLVVEFVSISARPSGHPKPTPPLQASTHTTDPSPGATLSKAGTVAEEHKVEGHSASSPANEHQQTQKKDASADAASATSIGTDSQAGGGQHQDDGYIAAIKAAILQRWSTLHPGEAAPNCALAIEQSAGGHVSLTQATRCSENQARALEAAALMAQPLPYAGYESAFKAQLQVKFNEGVGKHIEPST